MSWTTPKVDWAASDMATAVDMNRIFNNVRWMDKREDYPRTFTEEDIVLLSEWAEMISKLVEIANLEQLQYTTPNNRTSYDNFNNVEDILNRAKLQNDARWNMYKANRYAGQGFTSGCGIYAMGHVKDINDERTNMRKANHYAGQYRVGSGIYVGGYIG